MRARSTACRRLNDRRGVLDLRMKACAEPLGLGIIHLTLQVPATAAVGPRTLFVENPSKDKAAGTGAIEVR